MLFPYKYVPHSMEIMQSYIDFIFYEVWCHARGQVYEIDTLFANNDELREMISELHHSELAGADFFLTGLQQVFVDFQGLSDENIDKLTHWYVSNNSIELLCAGDPSVTPATYSVITELSPALSQHLQVFFKNLYSQGFLSLRSVSNRIGEIDDHYKIFMGENKVGKCPFCGIQDVKGVYHTKREAYDHYLPKSSYPFNSISFTNLAPACHECNSTYKLTKDPAYKPKNPALKEEGGRRKAFYPYTKTEYEIQLAVALHTNDWTNLSPDDMSVSFSPVELSEQITTWLEVYGIEERYKAKCCSGSDGRYWIEQVLDEWKEDGKTPAEFLQTLTRQARIKPYAGDNFLKKAFLKGCQEAGLFNEGTS